MDSVCEKLDATLIETAHAIAEWRRLQATAFAELKQGSYKLVDACREAPALDLGAHNYAGRNSMNATFRVARSAAGTATVTAAASGDTKTAPGKTSVASGGGAYIQFQRIDESDAAGDDASPTTKTVLRRRVLTDHTAKPALPPTDDDDDDDDDDGDDDSDAKAVAASAASDEVSSVDMSRNPLLWFGVLTPPELHHAATHYRTATEQLLAVANAQLRLSALQSAFAELKSQKLKLAPAGTASSPASASDAKTAPGTATGATGAAASTTASTASAAPAPGTGSVSPNKQKSPKKSKAKS